MEWGSGGNAGLGWRFLLACMGALACMGVSLLQSERGVGVSCVAVYICIHNLPRFPRCPNAPASLATLALRISANPKSFARLEHSLPQHTSSKFL